MHRQDFERENENTKKFLVSLINDIIDSENDRFWNQHSNNADIPTGVLEMRTVDATLSNTEKLEKFKKIAINRSSGILGWLADYTIRTDVTSKFYQAIKERNTDELNQILEQAREVNRDVIPISGNKM